MQNIFSLFIAIVLLTSTSFETKGQSGQNNYKQSKKDLPNGYNDLFAASGECLLCHNSQVNANNEAVKIIDDWRSTMMANAAKDPFWQAKVSHETLVNPSHAQVLEDVCSRCHTPMGNFNAHHLGQPYYSIDEMQNDPIALDGVSCTSCHQIMQQSLGIYSGELQIGTNKTIWGPYQNSFSNPMIMNTGYTPTYGEQILDSRLCATCHTLITNSVDLNGTPTGTEFVEQAPYQEWLNSDFPQNNLSCQTCHVPRINDLVKISSTPPWLQGRSPYGKHHLAGANVFMLRIFRDSIASLGITATETQIDTTIARIMKLLQEQSLEVSLLEQSRTTDTLYVALSLQNLCGHKFPTSYPSRRAIVELYAITFTGDTIFHSGKMNTDFNIIDEDTDYEPHYQMINTETQVQIYEMVMGNVNYETTTVLEQAYIHLKDNRIPPKGFTTNHPSYDTIKIAGEALNDSDFNKTNGIEGSGKDFVHYNIPVAGYAGELKVTAIVYYQTVSEKWLEDMFSYSSNDINRFKQLYYNSDRKPLVVSEENITSAAISVYNNLIEKLEVYPNPAGRFVYIKSEFSLVSVNVYNTNGAIVKKHTGFEFSANNRYKISLPQQNGVYLLELNYSSGISHTTKIVVNNH